MDVRVGLWRKLSAEKLMLLNCGVREDFESPLDCKEIQPVHREGDKSWVFIGRTDAEAETPHTLGTWWEELTHWKRPWCWEGLGVGGEGDNRGWHGWMASPTRWTWVWVSSGSLWWTGRPGVLRFMGRKESDTTEWLNWTEWHPLPLTPPYLPSPTPTPNQVAAELWAELRVPCSSFPLAVRFTRLIDMQHAAFWIWLCKAWFMCDSSMLPCLSLLCFFSLAE